MKQQQPHPQTPPQFRITRLQKILTDQKHQMLQKIKHTQQDLLTSRKHKQYKKTLEERVLMVDKFIKEITDTFFTMLGDVEFLAFTTQVDLVEKIDRFKKYVHNSMQKMTANLGNKNATFKTNLTKCHQNQNDPQEPQPKQRQPKTKPISKKSKNSKLSSQTSMVMTEWLLRNFQNPYPSTHEKLKMAKQSNISVTQVNNWFINARERTIKGYFNKEL